MSPYPLPLQVSRSRFALIDPQTVVGVLAEIAAAASGTLELQEVFSRVAASVRRLIPFDNMGVVRIVEGRFAVTRTTSRRRGGRSSRRSSRPPARACGPS